MSEPEVEKIEHAIEALCKRFDGQPITDDLIAEIADEIEILMLTLSPAPYQPGNCEPD